MGSVKSGLTKNEEECSKKTAQKWQKIAQNVAKNAFFFSETFFSEKYFVFLRSVSRPGSDSEMKVKNQSLFHFFVIYRRRRLFLDQN